MQFHGSEPALAARQGDAATLARLLRDSRADTLAQFERLEQGLPGLRVPQRPELNPPLWELGHVGWFQGWWTTRAPDAERGHRADPTRPRRPGLRPDAEAVIDKLYDSSRVAHATRWQLPLPDAATTRQALALQLEQTLALLAGLGPACHDDALLYPFRLVLLHEDMHHEAALYMAQGLGLPRPPAWQPRPLDGAAAPREQAVPGGEVLLGRDADAPGFAFDNECGQARETVADFRIDTQAVSREDFLAFVAEGYDDPRLWTTPGWAWRQARGNTAAQRADALAQATPAGTAAAFVSAHEAEAWCRWAGRRLPSEAEWVQAQRHLGAAFRWGDVWEWTASAFGPWAGFVAHPYRDYSAPWFDGRPVLKGASFMTQPRMRHADYRNFFEAGRCDIPAGLRSCAL